MDRAVDRQTASRRASLDATARRLEALSPFNVVSRGYAIVEDANGRVRTSARSFARGDRARVRLRDGSLAARVEEIG